MRTVILSSIRIYQAAISPWLPATCRYTPSCSEYARIAVERFGAGRGTWLAIRRLLRCHPFGSHGYDPVPRAREQALDAPADRSLGSPDGSVGL